MRLKAVQLIGRLVAVPGRHLAKEYPPLFKEFVKRFGDKTAEVRVAVINSAKAFLKSNSSDEQATEVFGQCRTSSAMRLIH